MSEGGERLPSHAETSDEKALKEKIAQVMEFREKMIRRQSEWFMERERSGSIPYRDARAFAQQTENAWHQFAYDLLDVDLETRKRIGSELGYLLSSDK